MDLLHSSEHLHLDMPASPAAVAFPMALSSRPVDRRVLAARGGRVAAGIALCLGGAGLAVDAVLKYPVHTSAVLAGAWVTALALGVGVWAWLRVRGRLVDMGRTDDRLLVQSFGWPIAGLALILPLTLHAPFTSNAEELDKWVAISAFIVGHCHIALAWMGIRRVQRLAAGEKALHAVAIYGIVVGIACVPGIVFLLVPPVLVALTGLPFIWLLWLPERMIARERAALA